MKIVLIGFGYDDYEVIENRTRNDPYAYRRLIFPVNNNNINTTGAYVYFNYSKFEPKFHSKIYFGSLKPGEFLLKGKFEICDDINSADIIVDNSNFSFNLMNINFLADDSQKKFG